MNDVWQKEETLVLPEPMPKMSYVTSSTSAGTQSTGIWFGQAPALVTGNGKVVEQGSGAEGLWSLAFFFKQLTAEQYEPWASLVLKLPTAVWITPRFPHCFSTWTNKTYRNTIYTWETAAEGNCCFCSPPTSNTGHTHVLKRINLQQGTGNISLKFFGKLITEITVPFFSSKAIRSSFPHLPHLYLKVTKITNMCVTVGNSS